MAKIYIDRNHLTKEQNIALDRIFEIYKDMTTATLPELEEMFEEAEDLWWEHLTYYAELHCQNDKDAFFERRYHDFVRLRKEQASLTINGNINVYFS